jgi:hypothetical protein
LESNAFAHQPASEPIVGCGGAANALHHYASDRRVITAAENCYYSEPAALYSDFGAGPSTLPYTNAYPESGAGDFNFNNFSTSKNLNNFNNYNPFDSSNIPNPEWNIFDLGSGQSAFLQPIRPAPAAPQSMFTANLGPQQPTLALPVTNAIFAPPLPEEYHRCPLGCANTFRRDGDFRRHMKMHGPPKFRCVFTHCDRTFHRKDKALDHAKKGHKRDL